jgi:His/Glu/Gln/Arg/opine family amino acid ABC transporter permease subunit
VARDWLINRLTTASVETSRNIPLLLQIFFWNFAVLRALPHPRESIGFGDVAFLNLRGLYLPRPVPEPGFEVTVVTAVGALIGAIALWRWGGLTLTPVLAVVGIVLSLPFGFVLALGRRSQMPMIRAACITYIELWSGVPLITVLFMASVMLPLFFPEGMSIDKLLRAMIGIVQQAFADPNRLGYSVEGYLFAGLVYWIFCFGMSRYSQVLEQRLHRGHTEGDRRGRASRRVH